jgi:hypothetical protein
MIKTAHLIALIVTALAVMPAHAQRLFVSGQGLDTNPCTVTQPCRTFQQAFNTAPPNAEINVLDPAGYGPLTITYGISIQGHGWGSITQTCTSCDAITIAVTTADPVILNGLILDGVGTGSDGIQITSAPSVQILNSVVHGFSIGINYVTTTNGANLLIEDTILSEAPQAGIFLNPSGANVQATLNRITANNNRQGVGVGRGVVTATIANSVMSNNSQRGLVTVAGTTWIAKNVISGNRIGVFVAGGTVNSYGDNYIRDNTTPVMGSLTPVTTQ